MEKQGILFIVSGPAGSGKGTVVSELRKIMPDVGVSVSATTRAPRPGELCGVNYHFTTRADFEGKIAAGEVLEYTEYLGNYYGTLRSEVERLLGEGRDVILEIEVEGAAQIKRSFPDSVAVMLIPPDSTTLERRLRGRGTETEEVILRRLERAREELKSVGAYDYVVINGEGEVERCAGSIRSIIEAEHCSRTRMEETVGGFFG